MTFIFALATFVGSALLFAAQPMVARRILPLTGGAPAVWSVVLVVFQGALLGGYLWARWITRGGGRAPGLALHGALLLVAWLGLPLSLTPGAAASAAEGGHLGLLTTLLALVGLPALALSATAPLVAVWFGGSRAGARTDPYLLAAASNAGSLLGLLAYPFWVEPSFSLSVQERLWSAAFPVVALVVLVTGLVSCAGPGVLPAPSVSGTADRGRWMWLLRAAVPSALVLAVTAHLASEVSSFPLLWVAPLSLYLLTWVVAFAGWGGSLITAAGRVLPFAVLPALGLLLVEDRGAVPLQTAAHLLALGVIALACHGQLWRTRPPLAELARFWAWVAGGGVLGGAAVAFGAPLLLDRMAELPALLVLGCLLARPLGQARPRLADACAAALVWSSVWVAQQLAGRIDPSGSWAAIPTPGWVALGLPLLVLAFVARGPRALPLALAGALLTSQLIAERGDVIFRARSLHGARAVLAQATSLGPLHLLVDGNTTHGLQYQQGLWAGRPVAYYGQRSPIAAVLAATGARVPGAQVGVVGLGAGNIALHGQPGWRMTFFEMDPAIVAIAQDERLFSCLSRSAASIELVLGDARLTLGARDDRFDLLVLDAFSSVAVPVHLLTSEAIALYVSRLRPGGMLAFNITHAHLSLAPVLAAAAEELGLVALAGEQSELTAEEEALGVFTSGWVVLCRQRSDVDLQHFAGWSWLAPLPGKPAWTDDRSSVLEALR